MRGKTERADRCKSVFLHIWFQRSGLSYTITLLHTIKVYNDKTYGLVAGTAAHSLAVYRSHRFTLWVSATNVIATDPLLLR